MTAKSFRAVCPLLALVVFWPSASACCGEAPSLRVATFQSDATLPIGDVLYSEPLKTVEHPLLAKGVVLDDGKRRYVLCAVDWCTMRNATHAMFQAKIAQAAGTEPAFVAVHCVHQHTAPSFDASAERLLQEQKNAPKHRDLRSLELIIDRLAASVRKSLERLEPFDAIGLGQAKVDRVASIRRVFTKDGKLLTRWSACQDPALRAMPEGEIDPILRTVSLGRDGKPLVRLHYYATHPQTYYLDGRASYDFPGMARERLQQEEKVFQIYFTGCAGDVTAGKYNDGTPEARAELAERLYQAMKASAASTCWIPARRVEWRSEPVQLKPRADAKDGLAKLRTVLADPNQKPQARISAAGRLACYERLQQPIPITLVEIGPAWIFHLPGEPMIAYQHFACRLVPEQFVAVAGYGLGTPGYVCTERSFVEGGYEPSASAVAPESERLIHAAMHRLAKAAQAEAEEDLTVLRPRPGGVAPSAMLYEYLKNLAIAALERRLEELQRVKTPDQARAYQQRRRLFFLQQLDAFPPRTPLNARVVGTLRGEGYRAEKVIYESQPNHHITAVLYLPLGRPPFPGVLIPCGHSYNGKSAEAYQRIGILLAKHNMAALCYDPIGQGERYQTFGPDRKPLPNPIQNSPRGRRLLAAIPGNPQFDPVQEHTLVGVGCILLGTNTARYRIFDAIRSLDYLASRPEVDPKRLGCTGNSGGGTLTSYLMALDDRVACAAPGCYLTTFRRLLETAGPQDAEQNLFGQLAFGLDQGDYVILHAPQPTLICAATRDATFDIAGTWELFRQAKRFYGQLGFPERVSLVEADDVHGFTLQLRIGAARWMRRWLAGAEDPLVEEPFPVFPDEALRCTPEGQVMFLPNECSVFELNRRREAELARLRRQFWADTPLSKRIAVVRETAGIRALAELPRLQTRPAGTIKRRDYRIEKLALETEPGIVLPALLFVPAKAAQEAVLYVHGEGKQADAQPGGPIESLVLQGRLVLAVDLRGLGEIEGRHARDWGRGLFGPSTMEFFAAYLLGKSLVGLRAEDILCCARFLAEYSSEGRPRKIHLVGVGAAGVPALHAAALEPELFALITLRRTLVSWADVVRTPICPAQLPNTVHGALKVYDLPDLRALIEPGKLIIEEPTDASGRVVVGRK